MALIKKRKLGEAEVPTSSMADIAFLLLVFFIVATTIDVDTGLGLTLPEYVENPETVEVNPDRMPSLNINARGDVLLDGKVVVVNQIKDRLKPRIEERINMPLKKKIIVSLKTDRETNYKRYIQALDQVKLAFYEVRDEQATRQFGASKFDNLNEAQKDKIKDQVPIIISIAEPEKVN